MRAIGLAAILLTAACAARPPIVALPPAPAVDVDALIRQGCYACLEAAFAAASAAGAGEQAFEAALLLVVRSKELGLPPESWLQRAAAIRPRAPEWAAYYDLVGALPPDPLSGGPDSLANADFARPRAGDAWDTRREGLKA